MHDDLTWSHTGVCARSADFGTVICAVYAQLAYVGKLLTVIIERIHSLPSLQTQTTWLKEWVDLINTSSAAYCICMTIMTIGTAKTTKCGA